MSESSTANARRAQIIKAARELYGEKGIERTSVKDITERAGITRSLFYHYFSCKEDVTDALLDYYIEEFASDLDELAAQLDPKDTRGSIYVIARLLRYEIYDNDAFRADLLKPENAYIYQQFMQRTAEMLSHRLVLIAQNGGVLDSRKIRHPYETYYIGIVGLVGYMRQHPGVSDDLIAEILADLVHADIGATPSEAGEATDSASPAA